MLAATTPDNITSERLTDDELQAAVCYPLNTKPTTDLDYLVILYRRLRSEPQFGPRLATIINRYVSTPPMAHYVTV